MSDQFSVEALEVERLVLGFLERDLGSMTFHYCKNEHWSTPMLLLLGISLCFSTRGELFESHAFSAARRRWLANFYIYL
jgi:hypothetical protein